MHGTARPCTASMRASRPPRRVGVTEREEFSNVRKLNVGTLDAGRCSFERDVGPTSSQRLEASLCEDSHSTSDTYLAHSLSLSGPVECYSTVALYPEAEPDAARSTPIHVSI